MRSMQKYVILMLKVFKIWLSFHENKHAYHQNGGGGWGMGVRDQNIWGYFPLPHLRLLYLTKT